MEMNNFDAGASPHQARILTTLPPLPVPSSRSAVDTAAALRQNRKPPAHRGGEDLA